MVEEGDILATGGTAFPFMELEFENPVTGATVRLSSDKQFSTGGDFVGPLELEGRVTGEFVSKPQYAHLQIPNLAEETKRFIRRLAYVTVRLGYRDGQSNEVLSGIVRYVENPREQTDDVLHVHCLDMTFKYIGNQVGKVSFQNEKLENIIRALFQRNNVPVRTIDIPDVTVKRFVADPQKSVIQTVEELVDQYSPTPLKFNLRQGAVVLADREEGFQSGVKLSPETGLETADFVSNDLGSPDWDNLNLAEVAETFHRDDFSPPTSRSGEEPISVDQSVRTNAFGNPNAVKRALRFKDVSFRSILQPMLVADSTLQIDSFRVQGFYRIKSYEHRFATNGTETSGQATPLVPSEAEAPQNVEVNA